MKLVTAMSTAAVLVLAPAVGLAQDSANSAGNTQDQPGLVNKVIGEVTGRSQETKEGASAPQDANKSGDRDSTAKGDTDYPDRASVKTVK
jgi:hypothetical protein